MSIGPVGGLGPVIADLLRAGGNVQGPAGGLGPVIADLLSHGGNVHGPGTLPGELGRLLQPGGQPAILHPRPGLSGVDHLLRSEGGDGDRCGTKPHPPIPHGIGSGLLERLGLNPQPLPPRSTDGGWCGTVPKAFPPPLPPVGPLAQLLGGLLR